MFKKNSLLDESGAGDTRVSLFENKRLVSLDLLRGLTLVFALYQHWGHVMTFWYMAFLKRFHFTDPLYAAHLPHYRDGTLISHDATSNFLLEHCVPYATHVFVALACFNIALKSKEEVKKGLLNKLFMFASLFLFFSLENFISATSFGDGLSIYPLQMWMVIFALVHVIYAYLGCKGLIAVFALSFVRFLLPAEEWVKGLQGFMQQTVHRDWEYNARFEFYIGTAVFGTLLGYGYRSLASFKSLVGVFGLSFVAVLAVVLTTTIPPQEPLNYFAHEMLWVSNFKGTLSIFATCTFLISTLLVLEKCMTIPRLPILHWVGVNSLYVFAWHRIYFTHISMPFQEWIFAQFSRPLISNFLIASTHVFSCLLLLWLFQKMRVFELISGAKLEKSS